MIQPKFLFAAALVAGAMLHTSQLIAAPTKKKPATTAQKPAAKPKPNAPKPNANLVALQLKLPRPTFIGTPKNIPAGTTVEKPTGKARPVFYVPRGTTNLAAGKTVTASDSAPIIGENSQITDGNKEAGDGNFVEFGFGKQWVQVDLERSANLSALVMWHTHSEASVYHDVVVQVSDDADFISGVKTVFNNDQDNSAGLGRGTDREYFELAEGKLVPLKAKGRYVRVYSNGSTGGDENRFTEIEIYGK